MKCELKLINEIFVGNPITPFQMIKMRTKSFGKEFWILLLQYSKNCFKERGKLNSSAENASVTCWLGV